VDECKPLPPNVPVPVAAAAVGGVPRLACADEAPSRQGLTLDTLVPFSASFTHASLRYE